MSHDESFDFFRMIVCDDVPRKIRWLNSAPWPRYGLWESSPQWTQIPVLVTHTSPVIRAANICLPPDTPLIETSPHDTSYLYFTKMTLRKGPRPLPNGLVSLHYAGAGALSHCISLVPGRQQIWPNIKWPINGVRFWMQELIDTYFFPQEFHVWQMWLIYRYLY